MSVSVPSSQLAILNQNKQWGSRSIQFAANEILKSNNNFEDPQQNNCEVSVIKNLKDLKNVKNCVGLAIIGHGSDSTIGQLKIFDIGMTVCKHQKKANKYPLLLFSCISTGND